MAPIVERFVKSFQKAVRAEMDAMREQQGPFEVAVEKVEEATAPAESRYRCYDLTLPDPNDKLILNGECTLVHDTGEVLVTITAIDGHRLGVRCEGDIPLAPRACKLIIYPWFLYERLLQVLEGLPGSSRFCAESALTLFGQHLPHIETTPEGAPLPDLNDSQQRAVNLCRASNVAFVWGPPGTGKTRTLGHIVMDLAGQGLRVVVTSTTNAAVDQALARLAGLDSARTLLDAGLIVRVGQTDAETFGAALHDVVRRQNESLRSEIQHLMRRKRELAMQLAEGRKALAKLSAAARGVQLDMFVEAGNDALHSGDLAPIFRPRLARWLLALPPAELRRALAHRAGRLERALALCQARLEARAALLHGKEQAVLNRARVVLATMTNLYISEWLRDETFDVVIVEEAGMAVLPTLFFCAGLGRRKVIAVGDPRQLPPIVVSRDPFVHRAMGRNIFDITVPDPHGSASVVMLDTQYRMHPVIGSLVSDLFYDGRLRHAAETQARADIAARGPYAGCPLVVVDTAGRSACGRDRNGYSRFNEQTAEWCVRLAAEAVADGVASVAIITPYASQSRRIRERLAAAGLDEDQVECRTVHRFQGHERDMVILDTVDTAPLRPGVLLAGRDGASAAPNLINVSLSRARGKLVVVADVAYFRAEAPGSPLDRVLAAAARTGRCVTLPP